MKLNNTERDFLLSLTMVVVAISIALTPARKQVPDEKINLARFVPASFGSWTSVAYDLSDYKDQWQSINELLVRHYTNSETGSQVYLVVEYNSDLRKNFTFHFPEDCHRSGGNEIIQLPSLTIDLPGHAGFKTKTIFVKGMDQGMVKADKLINYWLVMDDKQFSQTFRIKLDQMVDGLFNRSKQGFLIRVDTPEGLKYSDEGIRFGQQMIGNFMKDFYQALEPQERELFFGKP